jgi:hypothetical protein
MRKRHDSSGARQGVVITQAGKPRIMIDVDDDAL